MNTLGLGKPKRFHRQEPFRTLLERAIQGALARCKAFERQVVDAGLYVREKARRPAGPWRGLKIASNDHRISKRLVERRTMRGRIGGRAPSPSHDGDEQENARAEP